MQQQEEERQMTARQFHGQRSANLDLFLGLSYFPNGVSDASLSFIKVYAEDQ